MDISGVHIGEPDLRLLIPEDGGKPRLFHRVDGDEWCETVLSGRRTGSFDGGDLTFSKPIECSGGHIAGTVTDGQWRAREDAD